MKYFTSDTHFKHDKEFIFSPRGFKSCEEMNETQLNNINSIVKEDDELYILGDLVLGGNVEPSIIKRINCKNIYMIIGNHDTDFRVEWYKNNGIKVLGYSDMLKYNGYKFYLSHYITQVTHLCEAPLNKKVINLFGHTHQKEKFLNENPWYYNVGMDAHNNKPISIDEIIQDCQTKWNECAKEL